MIELLSDPQAWIACATLTALELVLGIDNIIFIMVDKLPKGHVCLGMAFSLGVETLNIRPRKKSKRPVKLHPQHIPGAD